MNAPVDSHPDEIISAYLDGAAGPEERARVEEHLRICPRCREMIDDFRSLSATAGMEEPPPVPPTLATRIRRQAEEARGRGHSPRRRAWRSPWALAAAGLAVATLVWVAVRQQGPTPTLPPATEPAAQKPVVGITPPAPGTGKSEGEITLPDDKKSPRKSVAGGVDTDTGHLRSQKKVDPGADEKEARDLRSLGYVQPGADEAKEDTLQAAKGKDLPEGAALSQGGRSDAAVAAPLPRSKRSPGGSQEAQLALGSAKESVVAGEAHGPRSLVYETPDITASLSEEGTITLILRGYACTVNVATLPAEEGTSSTAPELASLFTRASSKEILASAARAGSPGAPIAEEAAALPKTVTLRDSEGGTLYTVAYGDSPETAPPGPVLDLVEEIRRTVGSRFRKALEERCGPMPGDPALPAP